MRDYDAIRKAAIAQANACARLTELLIELLDSDDEPAAAVPARRGHLRAVD